MITIKQSVEEWKNKIQLLVNKANKIKDEPVNQIFDELGKDIECVLYPINNTIIKSPHKKDECWRTEFQFARVISTIRWSSKEGIYKRRLTNFLLERGEELYQAIPNDNQKKVICKEILQLIEPLKKLLANDYQNFRYKKACSFEYETIPTAYDAGKRKVEFIDWYGNKQIQFLKLDKNHKLTRIGSVRIDTILNNVYVIQQIYDEIDEYLDEANDFQRKILAVAEKVQKSIRDKYIGQIMAKTI